MSLPEIKLELLRAEYPALSPRHDPDIERYFELRSRNRDVDALKLYTSRLTPRYPDPDYRGQLLRAYRLRSPLYGQLMIRAYDQLGDQLLDRVKRLLRLISVHAQGYNRADAYSTIRAAEAILAYLPRERFEAIATAERLKRYAERLSYYANPMAEAESLVRAYLTESLDIVMQERERRLSARREQAEVERRRLAEQDRADIHAVNEPDIAERSRLRHEAEKAEARRRQRVLDLSSLRFSAHDVARIQIPPTLTRLEDQVLAYCFKYWNAVNDKAFERVILLYSRKNGTKHHDIYTTIRQGRRTGKRDEEILSSVLSTLVTGYYYSIRGDRYLQANWVRLKARLESAAPVPEVPAVAPKPVRKLARKAPASTARARKAPTPVPAAPREPAVRPAISAAILPQKPPKPLPKPTPEPTLDPKPINITHLHVEKPVATQGARGNGSIADMIKRLSGRTYDVFRERFLRDSWQSIHTVLGQHRIARQRLFGGIPKEAEEAVHAFLQKHYNNPYQDWASSEERTRLRELGFELESLEPVIEDCVERLEAEGA